MDSYPLDAEKIISDYRVAMIGKNGLGFYLALKMYFWANGSIPNDVESIALLLRTDKKTLKPIYEKLLALFKEDEDGQLFDPEIEAYRNKLKQDKEKLSEKNRKNILARYKNSHYAKKNEKFKNEIKTIWEYFCRKLDKQDNYKFSDGRKRLIRRVFDRGWNITQITQAIDNYSKDEWYRDNTNMDIKYVLRMKREDGEDMIGKFLERKPYRTGANKINAGDEGRNYGRGEIREV